MNFGPCFSSPGAWSRNISRLVFLPLLTLAVLPFSGRAALPKRLVLALDGVPYRDMKALQEGVTYKDLKGRQFHRQAFHRGYYPVSRMVSTFPSASDVAWTEIFGNRPLPGYQRTYYSEAANQEVPQNPITSTMEYERQMTWEVSSGFLRTLGYVFPRRTFKFEAHELVRHFLKAENHGDTFYALLRSPDDAQHLSADILAMLCTLDEKLQELRARYREREGRELEIVLLSDHGNNHAGPAERVQVLSFLKAAGYNLARSIVHPRDVVLPTTGIESWVEIHNSPGETERLVQLLCDLKGVDILTARDPNHTNQFIVMNARSERALIQWNPAQNSFRYLPQTGDPIAYRPVVEALCGKGKLDADGFATADAWMAETLAHRYPLAPERIVRGHTRGALNPATILISLDNAYVHSGWFVKWGSGFVRFGGTHGSLDDLNSVGMLLCSFKPTQDTSANRVAAQFDGFPGVRNYRAEEIGAELVPLKAHALATVARGPFDRDCNGFRKDEVFLRVWNPLFAHLGAEATLDITLRKARAMLPPQIRRGEPEPVSSSERHLALKGPISLPDLSSCERIYALPPDLVLEPREEHLISGRVRQGNTSREIFSFAFRTDDRGIPAAY